MISELADRASTSIARAEEMIVGRDNVVTSTASNREKMYALQKLLESVEILTSI